MPTLGAWGDRRRGQGRNILGGGGGYEGREEKVLKMDSAAVTLLYRPTPSDLKTGLSPASPLPCGGWGIPAC